MSALLPNMADVSAGKGRQAIPRAYTESAGQANTEKLILDHLPLVKHIVQKIVARLPSRQDFDDLVSAGTVALVRAAQQYDVSRDNAFSTYAFLRIRGAVIDELRRCSFVPSGVHARIRLVRQAWQEHYGAHGEPPDDETLARKAGMPLADLYRTLEEARNQQFLSIHGLNDETSALPNFLPAADDDGPDRELQRKELAEKLAKAIRELSEKERLTILLYYERDLTMKEAAEVLEVTESRISQLHASALFKLAMKLKESE